MAKLFDLNIDERLRLDLLAIHGPGDALVGRQVVGIDLKVRSTRLKDFLLWVELGIGASDKAFDLDNISGLATLWSVKNFDLQQNLTLGGKILVIGLGHRHLWAGHFKTMAHCLCNFKLNVSKTD